MAASEAAKAAREACGTGGGGKVVQCALQRGKRQRYAVARVNGSAQQVRNAREVCYAASA